MARSIARLLTVCMLVAPLPAWAGLFGSAGGGPGGFYTPFAGQPLLPPSPAPAEPAPLPSAASDGAGGDTLLCRGAIAAAERQEQIPDQLLSAIARVESGRADANGVRRPWPWTINAAGVGHFYQSKAEAIAAARSFQASGIQSIDVGCLQVNLLNHPDAFAGLDQAFDPMANAQYGARFLRQLFEQTGSWPHAAAAYHSQTPQIGADYQRRVLAEWAEPDPPPGAAPIPGHRRRAGGGGGIVGAAPAGLPATPVPTPVASLGGAPVPLGGNARILRLPGAPGSMGRGLDAYRALPITLASRFVRSPGS